MQLQNQIFYLTSVLSGNRNFEGRIHPLVKGNYLASPTLVVAYALAGTVDIDLQKDSLGKDKDGNDVYLADIWPSQEEVNATVKATVTPALFRKEYETVFTDNERWNAIQTSNDAFIHLIINQHISKTHRSLKECQKNQEQLTHLAVYA